MSNLAVSRLRKLNIIAVLHKNNEKCLLNAEVLSCTNQEYKDRYKYIGNEREVEGPVLSSKEKLYSLLFPIDLINREHIIIRKWRFM